MRFESSELADFCMDVIAAVQSFSLQLDSDAQFVTGKHIDPIRSELR